MVNYGQKTIDYDRVLEIKHFIKMKTKSDLQIKTAMNEQTHDKDKTHEDIEKDLNLKIMRVTTEIKDHYPELVKFLEEMPVTIPDEQNMEITLKNLKSYYDSLTSVLNSYITEQS